MQCFSGESLFGKGRSTCKGPGAGIYLGSSRDWNRMSEGEREKRSGQGGDGPGHARLYGQGWGWLALSPWEGVEAIPLPAMGMRIASTPRSCYKNYMNYYV